VCYTPNNHKKQVKIQKQVKNMLSHSDRSSLPFTSPTFPTPEAVFSLWVDELHAVDRASGTVRRYKSAIESFLRWYHETEQRPLQLAVLTPMTLVGYRLFLQQHRRLSPSTVNGHLSALRAWCAWLAEEHYLESNPAKRLKLVGREAVSKREGLEENAVNALLRQAQNSRDGTRNYAIVQLLLQTGLRLDECSHLMLSDIEFGERSGQLIVRSGKGNKARTVPLNASARLALAVYLATRFRCEPTVKAVAATWPKHDASASPLPLWQSQKQGRLTTSAMRQMIDVLVRDASTRGLVPAQASAHTLRHTFAHNYLTQHPGDIVGLATLLGHTSLDTTRIYSQPTVEQLATRVERLRQNAYGE
jgi:site-specific recombinase XerD